MINRIRNIALILLGVFIYPMLYQTLHNLHHHVHEINEFTNENPGFAFTSNQVHCVIFNYEFTSSDLPVQPMDTKPVYWRIQDITANVTIVYPLYSGIHKHMRAPPGEA